LDLSRFGLREARPAWALAAAFSIVAVVAVAAIMAAAYGLAAGLLLLAVLLGASVLLALKPRGEAGVERGLLTRIVDDSGEGVLALGAGGEVVYANAAYRGLAGTGRPQAPQDLSGLSGESRDRLKALERAARAGSAGREDIQITGARGLPRWLEVSAQALSPAGDLVVFRVRDIGFRREVEDLLRAERAKLADLVDSAPAGLFLADDQGRLSLVNETLAKWLKATAAELTGGLTVSDIIGVPAGDSAARSGRAEFEAELLARDGSRRVVEVAHSMLGGGSVGRSCGIVRDATEAAKTRQALARTAERFRGFFDLAPIGIGLIDRRGLVIEANERFGRFSGGAAGANLFELVRAEDRDEFAESWRQAFAGPVSKTPLEARFERPKERMVQIYATLVDRPGQEPALLTFLVDTSEHKRLELQFAQSQKMQAVGQLAGGIAHDFNNLLTAMIGFCDLLLLRHQPGDQSFADIMQIKQNASRAANLVRQLLAFSRLQTLRPKVLNVTDVLADLRNLLSRLIGEKIELKIVHDRSLGQIRADQGQLEQVIINLAVNARDAMPEGGKLTIRTANVSRKESQKLGYEPLPAADYVLIEVSDTGRGIAPELQGKVFEPFFTTKEIGQGTGLGLSTVYGIVKQTGGYIFLESAPGEGATFRIYLPRHRPALGAEAAAGEAAATSRDLTGKGTVLLVEDEDAVRTFAARALRNKGYTVLEAHSGEKALEIASQQKIDLLVSDVVMPGVDGPILAKLIRERLPDLRIIFISGYAEDAFRRSPDTPSDISFLPKPFSLAQLASTVKEVLAAKAPAQ
jgi:two-component system cell cycle sensor histidine kinase/response regulator CckA